MSDTEHSLTADLRRVYAEVSLSALDHNIAAIRASLPARVRLTAVVKADAYGHGAVMISERLQKLLNIIVAILTIAQVMQAVLELSTTKEDITIALNSGKLCLAIIIFAYLWSYFKDYFTRNHHN